MATKRLFSLFNSFSHTTLQLTSSCNFKCLNCSLWKNNQTTQKKSDIYKFQKQHIHIYGGEPFNLENIPSQLQQLKKQKNQITIWHNGSVNTDHLKILDNLIDHHIIFIPHINISEYTVLTGYDGLDNIKETILYLLEEKKNVSISTFISRETIEWLPDLYDWCFENKLPLILHINKNEKLSKESLAYIKRFKRIRNVFIFYTTSSTKFYCKSVPLEGIHSTTQILSNIFDNFVIKCRQRLNL